MSFQDFCRFKSLCKIFNFQLEEIDVDFRCTSSFGLELWKLVLRTSEAWKFLNRISRISSRLLRISQKSRRNYRSLTKVTEVNDFHPWSNFSIAKVCHDESWKSRRFLNFKFDRYLRKTIKLEVRRNLEIMPIERLLETNAPCRSTNSSLKSTHTGSPFKAQECVLSSLHQSPLSSTCTSKRASCEENF